MDIERVNEFTIKFFISYKDIESRGYSRDEIWYNRERGEELFWELMDEANHVQDFALEGPLWIQVQALGTGLEIVVTKAQFSKDGDKLQIPNGDQKALEISVDEDKIESLLDKHFKRKEESDDDYDDYLEEEIKVSDYDYVLCFDDFEDVISLSHAVSLSLFETTLYAYEDKYYLYVVFADYTTQAEQQNALSQLLEYGEQTDVTIHLIKEYGTFILDDALTQVKLLFK
ncbi:MAG TPA: adaptor protein MecA [Massilibacterium sp.]|nr:adaptor protein MecA [Massilibacterium sp.]